MNKLVILFVCLSMACAPGYYKPLTAPEVTVLTNAMKDQKASLAIIDGECRLVGELKNNKQLRPKVSMQACEDAGEIILLERNSTAAAKVDVQVPATKPADGK